MKRWLTYSSVLLMIIMLVSCGKKETAFDIEKFLADASETLNFDAETTTDLVLPITITYEGRVIHISWITSHMNVISATGIVNRPESQEGHITVTLTALLSYQNKIHQKNIFITVLAREATLPTGFVVTFETNGGSLLSPIQGLEQDTQINEPQHPIKEGYAFVGWFTDELFLNPWLFSTDRVTSDLTLYAKWEEEISVVDVYTVTFDSQGGTLVASYTNVAQGSFILEPDAPTKDGYLFVGWYSDASLFIQWDFETDIVTSHLTLYAKWEEENIVIETYTVTFDSNGGTEVAAYTEVLEGSLIMEPQAPTKDGCIFLGWFVAQDGAEPWRFELDVVTSNITLFAIWEEVIVIDAYTVTFDSNGGTEVAPYTNVPDGDSILEPTAPTQEGYLFLGWYQDESLLIPWNFEMDVITSNLILYAKWELSEEETPDGTPISTPEAFYQLATQNSSDSLYYLANDLDFTGFTWTPVLYTFTKELNGNGKTISNLTINGTITLGIFARVRTASIYNIHFDNVHVTTSGRAGILIGEVDGTDISLYDITITNSSVSGNSSEGVGGLIGKTKSNFTVHIGNISLIDVQITNTSTAAGSLIGLTEGSIITIQDVYVKNANITASNRVGGIFGEIKNAAQVNMERIVLVNLDVKGGRYIGGLIGRNQMSSGVSASDILIHGKLEATSTDLGHLSGELNISSIARIYVVELTTIGALNRQTVEPTFVIDSISIVTDVWWQTNLSNISSHPNWYYNGTTFALTGLSIPVDSITVRFIYGQGVQDVFAHVKEGQKVNEPQEKSIDGYTFVGWYKDSDFQTPYDFYELITETLTLYAKYEEMTSYIVTIHGEEYMVYENQTVTQPNNPSEFGKIFVGWFLDNEPFDFNTPIQSDLTIIARWEDAEMFTISFHTFGGDEVDPVQFYENQKIYHLPYATQEGYRFANWFLDEALTQIFTLDFIQQDYLLYAKFVETGELILEENFDYSTGISLRQTMWQEDKVGQAIITDEQTLLMTELSTEAIYSTPLDALVPGRYVLVFDFKQGIGGASFTIEMMNGTQRIFTVGANRANRFTYRNQDGSEFAIASSLHNVVPNEWHQAVIVFDTEHHFYKYFIIYQDELIELTPEGGIHFVSQLDITSIRIRIVGHGGSPSSQPYTYLDTLFIESSSETEEGKSFFDPEPAIRYEDVLNLIYDMLDIPFKDDVRDQLLLTASMFNTTIIWDSSNTDIISHDGLVTRDPLIDQVVIMNATFTKGDLTMNKEFEVTVKSLSSYVSFDETDYSLTGFALGHVSIPNLSEGDPGYYVVYTPQDFIHALAAENSASQGTTAARIIEIRADLNMGYLEVIHQYGPQPSLFTSHATPLMHPILKQTGVSKIVIQDRDGSRAKYHEGLMIFSQTGHTIKHASFNIKRANNIIIRNLKFDELWEWDEKTKGDYDSHDWDYFTIDTVNGIWFDHIELGKAYDGLIDFKAGSTTAASVTNATFSYMRLVFEPNAFILAQFEYLEANRHAYSYYNTMRNAGMSMEEIMHVNSFQKKGFLLGGSELRAGNVFTLTIYNSYIKNLQDRFPRLRGGDVHIFNSIYDATEVYETRNLVRELYPALFAQSIYNRQLTNQALVTTENGAIYMENTIIRGVTQVIKSNQVSRDHPLMTGKYLVNDSLYVLGDYVFYGSSLDENTAFIRSNSEPILPFSWTTISEIPYSNYHLIPVNILEEYLSKAILGVTSEPFNWRILSY